MKRMSHPLRVRGLKPAGGKRRHKDSEVAPSAGAWIETSSEIIQHKHETVAPSVGAWIETFRKSRFLKKLQSHPLRVYGLKQDIANVIHRVNLS